VEKMLPVAIRGLGEGWALGLASLGDGMDGTLLLVYTESGLYALSLDTGHVWPVEAKGRRLYAVLSNGRLRYRARLYVHSRLAYSTALALASP